MQSEIFPPTRKYKLLSLSSGSNGNCYYLGTSSYGILIDAGIGVRTIKKYLREYGVAIETIIGVLITHDHTDHIRYVSGLGNKMHIPVYATEAVHQSISRNRFCPEQLNGSKRVIEKEQSFSIRDFEITAFDVPHDSADNSGYLIKTGNHTIVLATDVGRITEQIARYASAANHLIIEANYDEQMLRNGNYPELLKQRIMSGNGHLSNTLTAQFLSDIFHKNMEEIWLCHLSQDNNLPELAYNAVREKLQERGVIVDRDVVLKTLRRGKPSGMKEF
ncbi:MAG: MBL fold metallo-hydrolase [Prevotella sp.]|jgi:phosphoribosyl 1,2-cyclic phosphodiesterase|nr:MBL fold metallo-hydrolase [Prevotella sp.]